MEEVVPQLNVKDFYRGKNILITGCTGFLGKIILEKLLRTCTDVGKIFVMVRPKRKIEPMQRVKD
jgi:fatty acyl-CoA reductase